MLGRSRLSYVALVIAIICMTPRAGVASTFAQSTFDTDRDGWLVKDLPFPTPGAPPVELMTFMPTQQPTGGNPGGRLTFADPTGNTWYWFAPAKFLGNKLGAYGGTLSFDLIMTGTGTAYDEEDVILVGGGLTLVFTLPGRPGTTFTSYHVGHNVVLEGSGAICDIQLNQAIYHNGDPVTAQVWRLGNQDVSPLAVEFKVWFEVPGTAPISVLRFGADGSVSFPAGFNQNIGPATLFTVAPSTPRGTYAFSCRVVNPVTGAEFTRDLNPFEIQ
jgi:hypothetical protein